MHTKKIATRLAREWGKASVIAIALVLMGILGGCSGQPLAVHSRAMRAHHNAIHGTSPAESSAPAVETLSVRIENFAFNPAVIKVSPGATVTWTNRDAAAHTVTFQNAAFTSGLLSQDQSWNHTFTQAGIYQYFCEPHPWMTGEVVVEATDSQPKGG